MAEIKAESSGASVVLGILIAVLVVVGGFFFLKSEGMIGGTTGMTTASGDSSDITIGTTEPAAGEPTGNVPTPAPVR